MLEVTSFCMSVMVLMHRHQIEPVAFLDRWLEEFNLATLDLLQVSGLLNYYGRTPESDNIQIKPVLLQKGRDGSDAQTSN
jgi:hypothetical protein